MSKEPKNALSLKIALIPEEGIQRQWAIDPESFIVESHQIPVEGPVAAEGRLYRVGAMVYFDGEVNAALKLVCSRCLENFTLKVGGDVSVVFMPHVAGKPEEPEKQLEAEDLDVQFYSGDEIDLLPPIRDYVALEIPMRPLCAEGCSGLCPTCGANLNQTKCACERPSGDPRFAALNKLISNQE